MIRCDLAFSLHPATFSQVGTRTFYSPVVERVSPCRPGIDGAIATSQEIAIGTSKSE